MGEKRHKGIVDNHNEETKMNKDEDILEEPYRIVIDDRRRRSKVMTPSKEMKELLYSGLILWVIYFANRLFLGNSRILIFAFYDSICHPTHNLRGTTYTHVYLSEQTRIA